MHHQLTVLTVTFVLSIGGLGAVSATGENDKITICHNPGYASGNKTMEISRSAWSGHKGHGDYEGACGSKAAARPGGVPPSPPARVGLSQEGKGELDGDATFRVTVANDAYATAYGLRLTGTVRGDGGWSVRPASGIQCTITGDRLDCKLPDLKGRERLDLRLKFDGQLAVCSLVTIDLRLAATNDESQGDDAVKSSAWVGACSPLDPDDPAAAGLADPRPVTPVGRSGV